MIQPYLKKRIDNLLSLMTTDEKIDCLGTLTGVPRLGVPNFGSSEGIHGVVQREPRPGRDPITTTQFPQPPGMGETWDPELVRQAGAVEGYEARFITQTEKYNRQILMLWGPQADLARDPRWGRSEEVYGEDPFFNGTMVVAFIKGLQDGPEGPEGNTGKLRRYSSTSSPTATEQTYQLVFKFRPAALLGILFSPVPHGFPRRRRQGSHGVVQRVERNADGD